MAITLRTKKPALEHAAHDYALVLQLDHGGIVEQHRVGRGLADKTFELTGMKLIEALEWVAALSVQAGVGVHVRFMNPAGDQTDYVATIDGRIVEADEELIAADLSALGTLPLTSEVLSEDPDTSEPLELTELAAGSQENEENSDAGEVLTEHGTESEIAAPAETVEETAAVVTAVTAPTPISAQTPVEPSQTDQGPEPGTAQMVGVAALTEVFEKQNDAPEALSSQLSLDAEPVEHEPWERVVKDFPEKKNKKAIVGAMVLATALVVGAGFGANSYFEYRSNVAQQQAAQSVAEQAFIAAHADAVKDAEDAAKVGALVAGSSIGQVADGQTHLELVELLDAQPQVSASTEELSAWVGQVNEATSRVEASVSQHWAQKLTDQLDTSDEVLANSDGEVSSETNRVELASLMGAARNALPAENSLLSGVTASAHISVLQEAEKLVIADMDAYKAEQKLVAEKKAKAEEAKKKQEAAAAKNQSTKPASSPKPQPVAPAKPASSKQPASPSKTVAAKPAPAPSKAPAKPAPAPGGKVTGIQVTSVKSASGAPGKVSFTVSVATSGATNVSVTATVGGKSVKLSGSGGAGTYTGTVTGIGAGSKSWSVSANGLSAHGSITVY